MVGKNSGYASPGNVNFRPVCWVDLWYTLVLINPICWVRNKILSERLRFAAPERARRKREDCIKIAQYGEIRQRRCAFSRQGF